MQDQPKSIVLKLRLQSNLTDIVNIETGCRIGLIIPNNLRHKCNNQGKGTINATMGSQGTCQRQQSRLPGAPNNAGPLKRRPSAPPKTMQRPPEEKPAEPLPVEPCSGDPARAIYSSMASHYVDLSEFAGFGRSWLLISRRMITQLSFPSSKTV